MENKDGRNVAIWRKKNIRTLAAGSKQSLAESIGTVESD